MTTRLTRLQRLEAQSIHILREVVAECERPVMPYSIGKDSAVMLHLARKAFHPTPPPFPLRHVDTSRKFRDLYALRDRMAAETGMALLVHRNPEALARGDEENSPAEERIVGVRNPRHTATELSTWRTSPT